ncbi:PREDICTED: uncharacterized protein LOC104798879 [Tarenaya hassleriana]|uniref:uncharacterized protein LOC104798879 n=1 Tax=Tarenaya hassleriana TaxID=28532 RepID=UPI00053C58E6|nr:PREDICTED: uncharacterized protein LOC104798879 [Tarenaya hassleriana]
MKKWADKKRRPQEYNVGDQVMVKIVPHNFRGMQALHRGLTRKYDGPYPIIARIGKMAYKLQLPAYIQIHPVFHVSVLKPYKADPVDVDRNRSTRALLPEAIMPHKEPEFILDHRTKRGTNKREFFIKWKGLPDSLNTWEEEDKCGQFTDMAQVTDESMAKTLPRSLFKLQVGHGPRTTADDQATTQGHSPLIPEPTQHVTKTEPGRSLTLTRDNLASRDNKEE